MITYDSPEKRFADQLLKNAEIRCLQQAIAELQGRLDRLEAKSVKLDTDDQFKDRHPADEKPTPKKRCGRPRISNEVKAMRKAEKERRKAEVLANPAVQQLTDTVWTLSGKTRPSQDSKSQNPKVIVSNLS